MRVLAILFCLAPAAPAVGQGVQMTELNPAAARLVADVAAAANRSFPRLPAVALTSNIRGVCGGDDETSDLMRYCVTDHRIYVAADIDARLSAPAAAYAMAHMFGHAIQVRHGVADAALAAIRAQPSRERDLRGMVTRQVECLAGVLIARADGGRGRPSDWFTEEPFTDSHWGAAPLSRGPKVSIGIDARDRWFETGYRSADVADCAVEDVPAAPLLDAER